ncbi:MAG: DUF1059 domain-containing protein [Lautropia sp.]
MYQLKCRDAGFDCPGVIEADTKADVLRQAAEHAKRVHQTDVDPAMAKQIESLITQAGAALA